MGDEKQTGANLKDLLTPLHLAQFDSSICFTAYRTMASESKRQELRSFPFKAL